VGATDQRPAETARARSLEGQGFISPQMVDTTVSKNKAAFAAAAAGQAALEQARAQLKAQKVALDYTEIRAPFDGVVLVRTPTWATSSPPCRARPAPKGPWSPWPT